MIDGINKIKLDFINEFDTPIRIINDDNIIVYLNKNMTKLFGNLLGEPADIICVNGFGKEAGYHNDIPGKRSRAQVYIGEALYSITSYSIDAEDGKTYIVEIFRDITEQKKVEAQVKNNYNKLLKETRFAKSIQKSVLPIDDIYSNQLNLRSIYLPADELSGDMYDIIELNEHETLMYIADVSGHGIRAALLTIFLRQEIRGLSRKIGEGDLDKLLDTLQKNFTDLDIDAEMYFSIVMCKYDSRTQELSFVNAGHNCFPLILRNKGRIEEIPLKGMPITKIGLMSGYDEEIIGIYSGDRIILYTDGIVEEFSETLGTEFGVQGIRNVISTNFELSGEDLCKKIINEAGKHSKMRAKDDRALMIVTVL